MEKQTKKHSENAVNMSNALEFLLCIFSQIAVHSCETHVLAECLADAAGCVKLQQQPGWAIPSPSPRGAGRKYLGDEPCELHNHRWDELFKGYESILEGLRVERVPPENMTKNPPTGNI
jgi:hypothetical protein